MADSQRPGDSGPQWNPSRRQDPSGARGTPHGANGFSSSSSATTTTTNSSSSSSSAYRACQPGAAGSFSARENGFNGDMSRAQAVTAEQVSARIVQEVTAEAVAVLKGEQESLSDTAKRLPSVEDSTNLPPYPRPSPAAQHFGPLERDNDRSMVTEIEQLPMVHSPAKKSSPTQEKQQAKPEKAVKLKAKEGRAKGRMSTPERKPALKQPIYIPREVKKKK
ncbi:hypothetical protein CRUP_007086, partial [Coryphaenoides rupestris]